EPVRIFFCYAHEDDEFLQSLKAHLRPLQRQGFIDMWHDRDITAGTEWQSEIRKRLDEAQIILLLISPDFMNSEYAYGVEMQRAIERHEQNEVCLLPVICRPTLWETTLGQFQALPTDAKPVASWPIQDEAFLDIAKGIEKVIKELHNSSTHEM